jgi:hypothetical protein
MSMKNSNDTIGNRSRDLPVCITVPQPTALPRTPCTDTKLLFSATTQKFRVNEQGCNAMVPSISVASYVHVILHIF